MAFDGAARETFAQRRLRTTMDVDYPAWLGWVLGGLQFQVLHHFFPRIPRHNLARGQKYMRAFSDESACYMSLSASCEETRRWSGSWVRSQPSCE